MKPHLASAASFGAAIAKCVSSILINRRVILRLLQKPQSPSAYFKYITYLRNVVYICAYFRTTQHHVNQNKTIIEIILKIEQYLELFLNMYSIWNYFSKLD